MSDAQPPSRRSSNKTHDDWGQHLERTGRHLREHGNLNRAGDATRQWADQQINALRAGQLDPPTVQQLRDAGITADTPTRTQQRSWALFLAEFDWWAAKAGDGRVPQSATSRTIDGAPYPLGRRVADHRLAYNKGRLPRALAEELDRRPTWTWSSRESTWEQRCTELANHIEDGHTIPQLPRTTYAWLIYQRSHLEQLDPDRLQRLSAIAGALDLDNRSKVSAFVTAARAWLKENPGKTMSDMRARDTIDIGGESIRVGHRVTYYRRRYRGLEADYLMTDAEIDQIQELPGWRWDPRAPAGEEEQ